MSWSVAGGLDILVHSAFYAFTLSLTYSSWTKITPSEYSLYVTEWSKKRKMEIGEQSDKDNVFQKLDRPNVDNVRR